MKVQSVKFSTNPVGVNKHNHDTHQILFVTDGKVAVNLDGKEEYLCAGQMLILSRFEEHSIRVITNEYSRYMISVSSDISSLGNDNYLLSSVLVNRAKGFRHIIDTGSNSLEFESILSSMLDEYNDKKPLFSERLDLMFNIFLISLYRVSPEIFGEYTKQNTSVVERIQSRFERDFSENFTLSALASEYHVSVSHLAHIFKSVTGFAPIDYLYACRLTAAKKYLATTNIPIKEIIDLCGFGDESNFSRMFRAKVGITPSAYRRQNFMK